MGSVFLTAHAATLVVLACYDWLVALTMAIITAAAVVLAVGGALAERYGDDDGEGDAAAGAP